MIDIVASAPTRALAARALVESAVRAWRYKYPTSKVDDCAVVCLFLDSKPNNISTSSISKSKELEALLQVENGTKKEEDIDEPVGPTGLGRSGTVRTSGKEVYPDEGEEDFLSTQEESPCDWSALEGVSRVNTLLTLPRFVPGKAVEKAAAAAAAGAQK